MSILSWCKVTGIDSTFQAEVLSVRLKEVKIMATRKKTEPIMEAPVEEKKTTKTGTVFGGRLNIRQAPDIQSKVVGQLEDGEKIKTVEDCGEWLRIQTGYVMAKWVK